jgi:archaellum biogenesis ATPase FlaH
MAVLTLSIGSKKSYMYKAYNLFDEQEVSLEPVPNGKSKTLPADFEFAGEITGLSELSTDELKLMLERSAAQSKIMHKVKLSGSTFLYIPKGVIVLMGGSGAGKTVLSSYIAGQLNRNHDGDIARVLIYNEPELISVTNDIVLTEAYDLIDKLAGFLAGSKEVCIIDSIRDLMYTSAGGATGKGGINMAIFSMLTKWDILAQMMGKTIIFNVNPLNTSPEVLDQFKEAASGAVTTVINLPRLGEIEFTSRNLEWHDRGWRSIKNVNIRGLGQQIVHANTGMLLDIDMSEVVDAIPLLGHNFFSSLED